MEQYINLLHDIIEKGTYKPAARENMPGTQSLFGYQLRHNLQDGFPLLTTKQVSFKNIVVELLWFLRGDTNIKYLVDRDVNIWNGDAYNYYCKVRSKDNASPLSFDDFIKTIKEASIDGLKAISNYYHSNYILGDCGFQYGKVWRQWEQKSDVHLDEFMQDITDRNGQLKSTQYIRDSFTQAMTNTIKVDQISNLIDGLKNNPESRRHIVTAIDPAHDNDLALYWCHALFQMNCRPLSVPERILIFENRTGTELIGSRDAEWRHKALDEIGIEKYALDCSLYQRSCDVFLGVPYNIASYSLLTMLLARICNMVPGEFIHTFGDVHIYDNHRDAVNEQLLRKVKKLPTVEILPRNERGFLPDNLDKYFAGRYSTSDFLQSLTRFDFHLKYYYPHPAIKAELSTGMKK